MSKAVTHAPTVTQLVIVDYLQAWAAMTLLWSATREQVTAAHLLGLI